MNVCIHCARKSACTEADWANPALTHRCLGVLGQSINLWLQHVWLTREYLQATVGARSPQAVEVASRLLANQTHLAELFEHLYRGSKAAVERLLKEHIGIATRIVAAALANDAVRVGAEKQAWAKNGAQIAEALKSLNARYDLPALKRSMQMHLDTTEAELLALLAGRSGLAEFEVVQTHILRMAEYLITAAVAAK